MISVMVLLYVGNVRQFCHLSNPFTETVILTIADEAHYPILTWT